MPDLGPYAVYVLSAYAATLGALAVLIVVSLLRSAAVRRELTQVEARRDARRGDHAAPAKNS